MYADDEDGYDEEEYNAFHWKAMTLLHVVVIDDVAARTMEEIGSENVDVVDDVEEL